MSTPIPENTAQRLGMLGVGAVALHADWYRPGDRDALQKGLETVLGIPAGESTDGGEHLLVWTVPAVDNADPEQAWDAIRKEVF
jgi:hypothetical protein